MIVLDTHALIWWVNGDERLSGTSSKAIAAEESDDGAILVSAITAWEIAMLLQRGRLALALDLDEWLATVASIERLSLVPISPRIAVLAARLPGDFHKDPADRFIVALAREHNAPLVTADEKIRAYPHVKALW